MSSNNDSCSIGISMNEACHKTINCRIEGLKQSSEFSGEDLELIKWRSGVSDIGNICFHHDKVLLIRYESLQKFDPFAKHKKVLIVSTLIIVIICKYTILILSC